MKQTYVHWFSCRYLASWADQWSLLDGGLQDAAQLTIPLYDADTLAALHAGCHCHCVVATHAAVLFLSKVNWFFLILEGSVYSLHAHRKMGPFRSSGMPLSLPSPSSLFSSSFSSFSSSSAFTILSRTVTIGHPFATTLSPASVKRKSIKIAPKLTLRRTLRLSMSNSFIYYLFIMESPW